MESRDVLKIHGKLRMYCTSSDQNFSIWEVIVIWIVLFFSRPRIFQKIVWILANLDVLYNKLQFPKAWWEPPGIDLTSQAQANLMPF